MAAVARMAAAVVPLNRRPIRGPAIHSRPRSSPCTSAPGTSGAGMRSCGGAPGRCAAMSGLTSNRWGPGSPASSLCAAAPNLAQLRRSTAHLVTRACATSRTRVVVVTFTTFPSSLKRYSTDPVLVRPDDHARWEQGAEVVAATVVVVLVEYDHAEMYYVGAPSESVE
uniref:Uncharacterized protein n=1 Tax=Oryza nivara TaxID=4536 RepID=A0A0E0IW88_ORYNI